ncbi:MAG: hypothetical protein EOT05_01340 [Candidatus Microsaccharimonas sossegonensis]|uniref:Glycosyltransferase RgtA/B/C/D-like domain-containing protein n=1 Tax=Candidatus Microsaccharimonas sossegonensis TaxID=2506948 RepID=A0A4Q0AIC7_9BACT|nr:MAG: hypothetical protein EOT05_01340 [Candidatus Microsaccharimonas sossegonensis]
MKQLPQSGAWIRLLELAQKHYLLITLIPGILLIACWTVVRFWSSKTIFDLIGQQVLAQTLLKDGSMDGTVGATNYILKLFFVYIPFESLHIDPRLGLILMTLLINIASFLLIVFAIRSIARTLNVFHKGMFVVAMIWFASLAGSILWIEFANSRNIEIAAGLWLVAIGLKLRGTIRLSLVIGFLAVTVTAFFMDPLQIYMTALPLLIFCTITASIRVYRHTECNILKRTGWIALLLIVGYVLAKALLAGVEAVTGIRVIDGQSSYLGITNLTQLIDGLKGLGKANIRLFSGYVDDGGRLRQIVALAGALWVTTVWIISAIKKKIPVEFALFVTIFITFIEAIYLLSGQSLTGDTSRYLVMVIPVFILLIASLSSRDNMKRLAAFALAVVVIYNTITLGGLLLVASRSAYSQDEPLSQIAALVINNKDVTFYGSMDTALPTMYYYPDTAVLPLSCSDMKLARARMFYPNSSFDKYQAISTKFKAVILDNGKVITNYPSICGEKSVKKQLGTPIRQSMTSNDFTVLYYPSNSFQF